jgi:hypothetical protein
MNKNQETERGELTRFLDELQLLKKKDNFRRFPGHRQHGLRLSKAIRSDTCVWEPGRPLLMILIIRDDKDHK